MWTQRFQFCGTYYILCVINQYGTICAKYAMKEALTIPPHRTKCGVPCENVKNRKYAYSELLKEFIFASLLRGGAEKVSEAASLTRLIVSPAQNFGRLACRRARMPRKLAA